MGPGAWMATFEPFMEMQTRSFYCPDDSDKTAGSGSISQYSVYVGESDYTVPMCAGPHAKVWTDLTVSRSATTARIPPRRPGCSCSIRGRKATRPIVVSMEDMSPAGQGDMLDMCVLVRSPQRRTTYGSWSWTKGHGYTHYVLYDLKGMSWSTSAGSSGCQADFHQPQQWKFAGGHCSYGISNRAPALMNSDSDHILFVEYCTLVANVLRRRRPIPCPSRPTGRAPPVGRLGPAASATGAAMNVLFFDGHVDSRNSAAINPFVASIANTVWKPAKDPCSVISCPRTLEMAWSVRPA